MKILLADDEVSIQKLISGLLEDEVMNASVSKTAPMLLRHSRTHRSTS